MSVRARISSSRLVPLFVLALAACKGPSSASTASPEPAPTTAADPAPPFEQNTFVSTSLNEPGNEPDRDEPEPEPVKADGKFVITTPEAAKEIAEAAVSDELDPQKTWTLSPVLPTTWPTEEPAVVVFFYPMVPNPPSITKYQLYTPAFRVTVSLLDATTQVKSVGKRRKLGTIDQTRPSSLERRELELAEGTLLEQLMGVEVDKGSRAYWGYLKYIHEHPKLGRDLERRAARFLGWVRRKHGR